MKRRSFIKNISATAAGVVTLGNIPVRVLAAGSPLAQAALSGNSNNVLIFIQLHGGNDALNSLIPISQYTEYYNFRENIAIPDYGARKYINVDDTIDGIKQVGLHPDMKDFKTLYDQNKAVIVQNVGYPGMNMSHFRGRDLVFMGLDGNSDTDGTPRNLKESGWMGRFLNEEYPEYPDNESYQPTGSMPDPIAIEMGTAMSLAFHRSDNIPIGLNIDSPAAFYELINSVGNSKGPAYNPGGFAGNELKYLWDFELMSNKYAGRLKDVYDAGSNSSVEYPEEYPDPTPGLFKKNPLSEQLRLIARLLKGGIKTRIFLCRMGGFDTHANQVEDYDSTRGAHAALMYHLSSAVKAFQDDLEKLGGGIEDRVLTMTFTEFGRRVFSNESLGTDHGTSTPVFIFGKALERSIQGNNPDLNDLQGGNMKYEVDYRQIYTRIVLDWFKADEETMRKTGFSNWVDSSLDLFGTETGIRKELSSANGSLIKAWPIPASTQINFGFFLEKSSSVEITIYDVYGKEVFRSNTAVLPYGTNQISENISSLKSGNYIYKIRSKTIAGQGQLIIK